MSKLDAEAWIARLDLQPHPEGGYFRETYRASEAIPRGALPDRFSGDRSFSTAIYYLLRQGQFSSLHRIKSDEVWHFYAGDPLTVHVIDLDGQYQEIRLGLEPGRAEQPQAVVPAGSWFGASLTDPAASFALVGCTVSPGFDFADMTFGRRKELLALYPRHAKIIEMLTHPTPDAPPRS